MLDIFVSVVSFVTLSIAAYGAGRPLLRWIGLIDDDWLTTSAFSVGVGLTTAGMVLLALGMAGVLHAWLIAALTMACCCWGLVEIGIASLLSHKPLPDELSPPAESAWPMPPGWLVAGVLAAVALVCVASLLGALTPPAADTALSIQLESAKRCLIEHRSVCWPTPDQIARPLLVDTWYLWALVFDGGVCAQLVHWGLGILLFAATVALATPLLGRPWAWLAASLVVLTPALNRQMSLPVDSVALAALCTLSLVAWCQPVVHGANRRWFVIAGLLAGGAMGSHYSAILLVVALTITWGWITLGQPEQRRLLLRGSAMTALIAIGIGFLCSLPTICFGTRFTPLSFVLASVAALPDHVGLVVLATSPGLLLARRLRGLGPALSAGLLYAGCVFLLIGDARLVFPAVPLLSVAAVWAWIELRRAPVSAQRVAVAALGVLFVCGTVLSLARSPGALPVALGLDSRDEYLLRHEPTYRAAAVANRVLNPDAHILSKERHAFYFDRRVTWENPRDPWLSDKSTQLPVQEMVQRLRCAGFTHLLSVRTTPSKSDESTLPFQRLADALPELTNYQFHTADGRVHRYRLVELR